MQISACPPSVRPWSAGAALLAALLTAGCNPPTETELRLATQTVRQDFGTTSGQLPSIPCSAQLNLCSSLPTWENRIRPSCDVARMECIADLYLTVLYTLDLSKDIAFQTGIGQSTADSVRDIILAYGLRNTLTFDVPETEVHLGPATARSARDPGVLPVGRIGPFAAGKDVPFDSLQLTIPDGSPAHAFLVDRIAHPEQPFAFLLSTVVPFRAGNPFPAGQLELRITPVLRLLKR